MTRIGRRVLVTGRVQGVAFRHHTKVRARESGLSGWVKNLENGDVEVWLEGEERDVETLLAWLAHGPPAATVTRLEVEDVGPAGHAEFKVRF